MGISQTTHKLRVNFRNDLAKIISASFIVAAMFTLSLLAAVMVFRSHQKIESRMQYFMSTTLAILEGSLTDAIWNFDEKAIETVLVSVLREPKTPLQAVHIFYPHTGENLLRLAPHLTVQNYELLKKKPDTWVQQTIIKREDQAIANLTVYASAHSLQNESTAETFTILASFLVGFSFVSFFVVKFLNHILSQPLHSFISALRQAKGANYNSEIKENLIGELGTIAAEFNGAIKAIAERDHRLHRYANHLESEIKAGIELLNEQKSKAENSARLAALGEISAGVAHEINNPLAVIVASSEKMEFLLNRGPEISRGISSPEFLKEVARIKKMVDRISKIVKGLRTFSRDGTNAPMQSFKPCEMIEELLGLVRTRIQSRGADITAECQENLTAWGNEIQISQVLINLINNSMDAIADLPEKWIKIRVFQIGSHVEFSVMDSGQGIPIEVQEKIFQPFFTTKEVGKGTGLGLSIAHGIIKAHDGQIEVDSSTPHTCIRFTISQKDPLLRT